MGNAKYLKLISIPDHHIENYKGCDQFDIAEDENSIAIALAGEMNVYAKEKLITAFKTDFIYPRRIKISSKNDIGDAHKLNGILLTSFTDEFCNSIAVESHID